MTKNVLVKIGGVDVTSYVRRVRRTETYGNAISELSLEVVKTLANILDLDNSLTVEVWQDTNAPPTTKVFNGFIDRLEPETGLVKIIAKDQLALLINKQFTKSYDSTVPGDPSYPSGKLSLIFKDIVETYGGLSTNSGATVQDSGTDTVLTQFKAINADPFERCKKLSETLNWVFYYRADTGYVYFEPKNYSVNTNTLQVGVNVIEVPKWDYDRSEMINDLTVNGAQQLVQASELFRGDGSTKTFTLTNAPEDIAVYYSAAYNYVTTAKLSNQVQTGNILNSLGTYAYTVDRVSKSITFVSAPDNIAAPARNILVEYSYYVPIPVRVTDDNSISTYGTYAKTLNLTDVTTFNDSQNRGLNILNKYAQPFRSTKLKVRWTPTLDLRVGQQVSVIDNINIPVVNQPFTIYSLTDYYPEPIIEVEVGDKQYTINEYNSNVLERLKRLEDSMTSTTGSPTEIRQPTINFGLVPDITTLDIELVNDSFILNHPVNGVLYDEAETAILDGFELAASWTGVNSTLTDDTTAGHYQIGTQGINASWTGAVTTTLTKAISSTDVSGSTGASSGTPITGTVGLWVYAASGSKIMSISLRLGSDSSNYMLMTAQTFVQANSITTSFSLQDGLNYLVFDLPSGTKTGTPVWTGCDYAVISVVTNATSNATFDYLTVSKSNDIGLNGLGGRSTTWSSETIT